MRDPRLFSPVGGHGLPDVAAGKREQALLLVDRQSRGHETGLNVEAVQSLHLTPLYV